MAVPGIYQARQTVKGEQQAKSFKVLADPKLEHTPLNLADMQAQEKPVLDVIELESKSKLLTL